MPPSLSRCFRHCWENSIGSKLDLENRLVQKGLGLDLTLIHVPWSKHSIWIGRLGYCHPTITGFPNDSVNDVNGCSHTKALWKYTLAGPIGIDRQLTQLTLESMDWFQGISTGNKGMDWVHLNQSIDSKDFEGFPLKFQSFWSLINKFCGFSCRSLDPNVRFKNSPRLGPSGSLPRQTYGIHCSTGKKNEETMGWRCLKFK